MTTLELKRLNYKDKKFKRKALIDDYWFELKINEHLFITCDSLFALKNKLTKRNFPEWCIGYQNKKTHGEDIFWFNNKLIDVNDFIKIAKILTGKDINKFDISTIHKP